MTARAGTRLVVLALVAGVAAACGDAPPTLRLRHEPKRQLVYELRQHEEAPHPVLGLGGSIDVAETVTLGCLNVDGSGLGEYEVAVRDVKLTAPPETGVEADTRSARPLDGDRTGANAVALSLLPRTAIVGIRPDGFVRGARPDAEIQEHVRLWLEGKPVASKRAIVRLADAMDAGPVAFRWFQPLSAILPEDAHAPHGAEWTAHPAAIETPAGNLAATLPMMHRREGDLAVLEGKGALAVDGDPPAKAPVTFEGGSAELRVEIDVVRGVLVSWTESGEFRFRTAGGEALDAPWRIRREMKLVEVKQR